MHMFLRCYKLREIERRRLSLWPEVRTKVGQPVVKIGLTSFYPLC